LTIFEGQAALSQWKPVTLNLTEIKTGKFDGKFIFKWDKLLHRGLISCLMSGGK